MAEPAAAAPTLTMKQARTETRKAAKQRATGFAGYPDSVRYRTGMCNRSSARRIVCQFTVLKDLDDGRLLTCFFKADVRLHKPWKVPDTFSAQVGECTRA